MKSTILHILGVCLFWFCVFVLSCSGGGVYWCFFQAMSIIYIVIWACYYLYSIKKALFPDVPEEEEEEI